MKLLTRLKRQFSLTEPSRSDIAAELIHDMRHVQGMSTKEIVSKSGLSQETIRRWEARVVEPQVHLLAKLKRAATGQSHPDMHEVVATHPGFSFSLLINHSEMTPETGDQIEAIKRALTEIQKLCPP
ncbi:MAG: helix-turn-helix transcriptional regulator [bacterium]|nr:helix-turn-helix transcriptional regulator [bacterium]